MELFTKKKIHPMNAYVEEKRVLFGLEIFQYRNGEFVCLCVYDRVNISTEKCVGKVND